jgi:ubiquinone biosynthesis monooxygenase Coq6
VVVKMRQLLLLRQSLRSIRFSSYSVSSEATVSHDWPNPPVSAENVDITIAGGGLVGSAMALAFASSPIFKNHKIILLESQSKLPKVSKDQPYSNRVCALNAQSINLFQTLGAWDLMKSIRVQEVARMQVWDACSESLITFDRDNQDSLAYIVENDVIQSSLLERLKQFNIEIRLNSKVKEFEYEENSIRIKLQDDKINLRTGLLIAADGYQSSIREMAQISTMQWNYDQFGIVATLQLADNMPDNVVAWQRFLPTGPIACLPLSNTHSSLVWTVPKTMHTTLLKLSDEQFVDEVNKAFTSDMYKQNAVISITERIRTYWQQVIPVSPTFPQYPPTIINIEPQSRAAFPLSLLNANQYVRPRLVLVGDSAHRIHPMAGQGVNMGFADVECLVKILEEAIRNGADFSSLTYLVDYERQHQAQCLARLLSIDSLNRLYSTKFLPIVALRSVGLSFVNEFSPFKKFFAQQASSSS